MIVKLDVYRSKCCDLEQSTKTSSSKTKMNHRHYQQLSVLLLVFVACLYVVNCDLPLHCEHQQIHGQWMVFMGPVDYTAKTPLACQKLNSTTFDAVNTLTLRLQYPNIVKYLNNNEQRDVDKQVGTWTMVYDQGFHFDVNNMRFFAYNRFTKKPNSRYITSFCAETTYGWYQIQFNNNNTIAHGCYIARKIDEKKTDTVTDLPVNDKLYKDKEEHLKLNTHQSTLSDDSSELFESHTDLIDHINQSQDLWKAERYPQFEKLTKKEMNAKLGKSHETVYLRELIQLLEHRRKVLKHTKHHKLTVKRHTSGSDKNKSPVNIVINNNINNRNRQKQEQQEEQMSDETVILADNLMSSELINRRSVEALPESWDWRNVSGVNYVSPVRDQGGCGSCYTFATLAALESRIRILTNNEEQVILAPQDIVSCSAFTQNCSGGFPFLVGKYLHDFSLVPEDCFKYQASAGVSCERKCSNPRLRVAVKRNTFSYIGGYYGASHEENMMREIYTNGPIPVSYVTYPDFMYYKTGIYTNVKAEFKRKKDDINDFEATTHSVALVGWGVDKKTDTKYWIAKNSWGPLWGDNGYFLIKRGVDEAAIEAQAVNPGIPVLVYSDAH